MTSKDAWHVTGRLRVRETGVPLSGLLVELWDRDLIRDDPLGKFITDDKGRFKMDYATRDFSDRGLESEPDLYVRIWLVERKRLLLDTREVARENASRREHFDLDISCWLFDKTDPKPFVALRPRIRGTVHRARQQTVLKNVIIKAVERSTGKVVAEGTTGLEGSYGIWVVPSDIRGSKEITLQAYVGSSRVFESPPMRLMENEEQVYHIHISEDDLLNLS